MTNNIYIIAGEASGDFIGAQLMQAMKAQNSDVRFSGIGGPLMKAQGFRSLFPMEELSLMGIAEILPKLFNLMSRINQTVADIINKKPDMVITIDAPDFSFRVQKKIRSKMDAPPKQVHYVAPTVWAWREKRALKVSKFLDAMICLFDFEPPYFKKVGLKSVAVGHPMIESGIIEATSALIGDDKTKKLGLFLGSRKGELKRTAPVLIEAVREIIKQQDNIELIVPTLPHLEKAVTEILGDINVPVIVTTDQSDKWSVFKACDAAIAVSGTVGLELAVANVPHIIAYKASPLTAFIVRRLIKTPFVHLANIILKQKIAPELIQEECNAYTISEHALSLLNDEATREAQTTQFSILRQKLGELEKPSTKAATYLFTLI